MEKTEILKQYFGHTEFRSGQESVIDNILSGRDCLAVMPTGAGKSMCFQIPALMLDGVTIVISPLISLMKDQVEALTQSGVAAAYINSTLDSYEYYNVIDGMRMGQYKLIYVAPERLLVEGFLSVCREIKISLVAVDEAHCVSHWGHDFRSSYLHITEFITALYKRPVIAAFTATATDMVKRDIIDILQLDKPYSVTTGFDRPNLYFEVRHPKSKDGELLDIIRKSSGGSIIVYCSTRKAVENVTDFLTLNGCSAKGYHAGMPDEQRKAAQEAFIYDRCNIIVATNAFGMGIDKSDVSLVVHYNMPKDPESYYQEAGRAGRDGGPARCILLFQPRDIKIAEFLIEKSYEESELPLEEAEQHRERDKHRLKQMANYCYTEKCLRKYILGYFGENAPWHCDNCSSCNGGLETEDITIETQKILSCIFRLSQRGRSADKALLADILCGSQKVQVVENSYDTLSTYGIMKDTTQFAVAEIIAFLCDSGYIDASDGMCRLTAMAQELVKSRRTLLMKRPKKGGEPPISAVSATAPAENEELMAILRAVRKKAADVQGVPAYVVFSDATLREMSIKQPLTEKEFLSISGVGTQKTQRYFKRFSTAIAEYQKSKGGR